MKRRAVIRRRAIFALVTIVVALTMNFALFRAAPGSPVYRFAQIPGISPEQLASLENRFGVNESLPAQYWAYVKQLARGDLGTSFSNSQPVSHNLLIAYRNTLPMVALGVAFAIVLGLSIGVIAASRRGGIVDHLGLSSALTLYSLPSQWLGLMLLFAFGGILPTSGRTDDFLTDPSFLRHVGDVLEHTILPSLTLGLVLMGQYALIVRSAMLETLGEDYVLTARAKGVSTVRVVTQHGLRNALLPISTLMALSLGFIVSGSILIETVFSYPGVGRAVYDAVLERDWPMLQGAFLIITVSVVVANFLLDLLYYRLDPRIAD